MADERRTATMISTAGSALSAGTDWVNAPSVLDAIRRLPAGPPRFIARAPGRLDVMGGLGEYAGGLHASIPLGEGAWAAVSRREDRCLSVVDASAAARNGDVGAVIPLSRLFADRGRPIEPSAAGTLIEDEHADVVRCVVGALMEMVRVGMAADLSEGLSVVASSNLPDGRNLGCHASLAAAVITAAAQALDVPEESSLAVNACRRAAVEWTGGWATRSDPLCVLTGEPNVLTLWQGDLLAPNGQTRLPDHLVFYGLDCGFTLADAERKHQRVRTAAEMGRLLIERIIEHEGMNLPSWNGRLTGLPINDYVERFRDRIPTKMKGREFLQRFGPLDGPTEPIEADYTYKIRSRAEHQIYEHARARQFMDDLAHAIRTNDAALFREVGELMYASHWSYGQRCGLGSVEADWLIALLRRELGGDLIGAKMTGIGCGGTLAVLLRPTEHAIATLPQTVQAYEQQTHYSARLIAGAVPGALLAGTRPT